MSEKELKFLSELLVKLDKANETLEYSFRICEKIGGKNAYTPDEEDRFEALTAKFARLSDLILKKVIRTIDKLDIDDPATTMRDTISRAEKKGLISGEMKFIEIRKRRNEIAHEYAGTDKDFIEIYKYVLENSHYLFDSVNRIKKYCEKY